MVVHNGNSQSVQSVAVAVTEAELLGVAGHPFVLPSSNERERPFSSFAFARCHLPPGSAHSARRSCAHRPSARSAACARGGGGGVKADFRIAS